MPWSLPASSMCLLVAGMLRQFWLGVEVLGPLPPSHWFEVESLGLSTCSLSSFRTLGDTWLPFALQGDFLLGHSLMGTSYREENARDRRWPGGWHLLVLRGSLLG